jgi:hypothetical protein
LDDQKLDKTEIFKKISKIFSFQTAKNRISSLGLQGSKLDKKPPALKREHTAL